jgi:hypothetical protein
MLTPWLRLAMQQRTPGRYPIRPCRPHLMLAAWMRSRLRARRHHVAVQAVVSMRWEFSRFFCFVGVDGGCEPMAWRKQEAS